MRVSVVAVLAVVALAGCSKRPRPAVVGSPVAPVTGIAPDAGRESIVKRNGQCTLVREVLVPGPVVNGRETYQRSTAAGAPYPC